jgi:hypothetical protein
MTKKELAPWLILFLIPSCSIKIELKTTKAPLEGAFAF